MKCFNFNRVGVYNFSFWQERKKVIACDKDERMLYMEFG